MLGGQVIIDSIQWAAPAGALVATACLLFLIGLVHSDRHVFAGLSVVGLLCSVALAAGANGFESDASVAPFFSDRLAELIQALSLFVGIILVLLSWNHVPDRWAAEYHACLLLIIAGTCLTAVANELITLFLALELISIPTYILLYLPRYDGRSQEAAAKYFLLSIFSSAVLLYGFSILYGLAGSTNLELIRLAAVQGEHVSLAGALPLGAIMVIAGLGFRITAVPFHFYAPDVYQGSPTVGAALLAVIPKIAGFLALIRLIGIIGIEEILPGAVPIELLWILAAATMTLGNILALLQDNIKRMFAYSSVAHAGYMLVGLSVANTSAASQSGLSALLFYLTIYSVMTLGSFGVLSYLSNANRSIEGVDDLSGLSRTHGLAALMMAVFMFSLTGLPLTGGFWGKFNLFMAAWSEGSSFFRALAIVMAVNAAVASWYYLRIVAVMYLRSPIKPIEESNDGPGLFALTACSAAMIAIFVNPNLLWQPMTWAARGMVGG